MPDLNPFVVGRPLLPEQFIGYENVKSRMISQLRMAGSASIVGASQTGRTSFLRYLVSDHARQIHSELSNFWPILYEVWFGQEFSYESFWSTVFKEIESLCRKEIQVTNKALANNTNWTPNEKKEELESKQEQLERLTELRSFLEESFNKIGTDKFNHYVLREVVNKVVNAGYRLLLAIDNFDVLMTHPNLTNSSELRHKFFGHLRSLGQLPSHGLAIIVTATRQLADIWQFENASQLFNIYIAFYLKCLSDDEVNKFLDHMLHETGIQFSDSDKREIRSISGNLPAYIQFYANLVFESYMEGESEISRKERIKYEFEQRRDTFVQLNRQLLGQMNKEEKAAVKKAVRTPNLLSVNDKNILRNLKARGGLPPLRGVLIP